MDTNLKHDELENVNKKMFFLNEGFPNEVNDWKASKSNCYHIKKYFHIVHIHMLYAIIVVIKWILVYIYTTW